MVPLQLGHGDYSSANTKVLRMVNTLGVENEAKQTIEALQNELQKTKEQLLAVQELKGQSGAHNFNFKYMYACDLLSFSAFPVIKQTAVELCYNYSSLVLPGCHFG